MLGVLQVTIKHLIVLNSSVNKRTGCVKNCGTYQNTFTGALLFAASAFETDEGAANKAERGVLWHLFAGRAGLPVIVLEDDIVVVR